MMTADEAIRIGRDRLKEKQKARNEYISACIAILEESAEYFKVADCDVRAHECYEAANNMRKLLEEV